MVTTRIQRTEQRKIALTAGISLIIMTLAPFFRMAFLPQYDGIKTILTFVFTVPMIAGELGFGLWILFKGGKVSVTA